MGTLKVKIIAIVAVRLLQLPPMVRGLSSQALMPHRQHPFYTIQVR